MTKIEIAQASADRRYSEYLKACQRVAMLVEEKKARADARIAKIKADSEAKVKALQDEVKNVKTINVEKSIVNAVNAERAALGLSSCDPVAA